LELQDYLRVFRKNWLVLLVLSLLGAGLGLAYAQLATPTYSASARVFVSTSGATTAADLQQGNTFTQQRVKTYAELVTTAAVLQPTIDSLNLNTSVAKLRGQVSASAPLNTTVINVTVAHTDAVFAATLATETANQLIDVVEQIETTNVLAGSPVRLTVVQEAEVPSAPTSPKKALSVALGLIVGMGLGVAIALVRAALDTKIRNEKDVERLTDLPVLGGIVFDPKAKERPLIVHEDSASPRAENFRTLRTNLQFLDAGRRERAFVVTSAVPGEGKSTTTANLAIALAQAGAKVLLVGADLRKPKMAHYMGIEGSVGLTDVLIGRVELTDALQRWGRTDLFLLPSGQIPPNPSELLGSALMDDLIARLNKDFDVVLYDAPPLLPVTDAAVLARLVGGCLVLVASGRTTSPELETALATLENVDAPVSGVVLTMLPTRGPDAYGYGRYGYAYHQESPR